MLSTNQNIYSDAHKFDLNKMSYCELPDNEKWRIPLVQEILDVKSRKLKGESFKYEELDVLNGLACCA